MYSKIDKNNMFDAIWDFPDNLLEALALGNSMVLSHDYHTINNIVISGMGGSAIGADIISILERNNLHYPYSICRGYTLPNWVNENSLVICSSYSGNTEETLSSLDDAIEKNAQVCGITTGGILRDKLNKMGKDVIIIPSGLQPRAALAFSFIPMIKILENLGLLETNIDTWLYIAINSLKKNREKYCTDSTTNPIFTLSKKIYKKIPIIYADSSTLGIAALRLKGQICENSKMLCYHNELPEMNHNEIVGWKNNQDLLKNLYILWLIDSDDNHRVKQRYEITHKILDEVGANQHTIKIEGKIFEDRFLNMIHYGDWLSFWCAIAHKTNPSPVDNILRLKNELIKRK